MLRGLIVLAATTVATVATTVIVSNVKRQKEEKGKFDFKGLFEKAAAKQAAKDSVKAVKGGIRRYFDSYGWALLILGSKEFIKSFGVKNVLSVTGVSAGISFGCVIIASIIATLIGDKDKTLKEKLSLFLGKIKEGSLYMIETYTMILCFIKDIITILLAYSYIKSKHPLAMFNTNYKFIIIQLILMLIPTPIIRVTVGKSEK